MEKRYFGTLPTGEDVFEYTVTAGELSLSVLDFGACVRRLTVRGRDVAGGFDEIGDYLVDDSHQGGLVGRVANRIGGAEFELGGVLYRLPKNNGENCLHGGEGFDRRMWTVTEHKSDAITLEYNAKDGEEGFPSALSVRVEYRIEHGAVVIDYTALPDGATPISLTNHTYFNLDGLGGDVLEHTIMINAERYTAVDDALIPTGERPEVAGTAFDLRTPTLLSLPISALGGIDHNYILSAELSPTAWGVLRHAATLATRDLTMQVYTDRPGVQLYTGNFLGNGPDFKGGIQQIKHGALCLEAQTEPNGVKHGHDIYNKGETYRQTTVYAFD